MIVCVKSMIIHIIDYFEIIIVIVVIQSIQLHRCPSAPLSGPVVNPHAKELVAHYDIHNTPDRDTSTPLRVSPPVADVIPLSPRLAGLQ